MSLNLVSCGKFRKISVTSIIIQFFLFNSFYYYYYYYSSLYFLSQSNTIALDTSQTLHQYWYQYWYISQYYWIWRFDAPRRALGEAFPGLNAFFENRFTFSSRRLCLYGAMTSSAAVSTSTSGEGRAAPPTPAKIAESNRSVVFQAHNGGRGENPRHHLVAKLREVSKPQYPPAGL